RVLERERAHLLGKIDRVAARRGPERATAAAEEIDPRGAVACGAGALLPVHLLAGAVDLASILDVVGAALRLGELPAHAAVQDVRPRLEAEDRGGQFDRPRRFAVERHDLEFHVRRPPCRRLCLLRRTWPRLCRRRLPPPAGGTCRAWERPSAVSSSPRRAAGSSRPWRLAPRLRPRLGRARRRSAPP